MANGYAFGTLRKRYQEVGAQGLRPFRSMANATLRYQEDLEEVRSNIKSGKLSDLYILIFLRPPT
ncbi:MULTISPECIES: hypothetical protein [Nostocales]|jgi:hypothetical protein|uniref:Uncharacterized protein n=3 Tax=Aphanizomenonaceae TaxID=1892259 RepID=A0A1Z4V4B3_9CYAN|nr:MULTISPECIES: hypothetical protein [Nostocales]MBD2279155.1 hypothetical protein [Aphanizomenon flos-aquae FACHB-1040]MBO1072639.1 hypothetical protein [Dolichospermum sp. DEX189]MCX5981328.1 hypothetical protein [Nostocales cyanobacterium LacPavin_0920_SED1_MAG_38_18]BAZ86352.1 hypothetical protein NIES806_25640 [Dolichospermum compactum NIES-806]